MNLLSLGQFHLHSGDWNRLKIDCDALTDVDLEAIAFCIVQMVPPFGDVIGVPSGGIRLERALQLHCTPEIDRLLIVDDVLTTGSSMIDVYRSQQPLWDETPIGAVIFARGICPEWVTPVFYMNPSLKEKLTVAST